MWPLCDLKRTQCKSQVSQWRVLFWGCLKIYPNYTRFERVVWLATNVINLYSFSTVHIIFQYYIIIRYSIIYYLSILKLSFTLSLIWGRSEGFVRQALFTMGFVPRCQDSTTPAKQMHNTSGTKTKALVMLERWGVSVSEEDVRIGPRNQDSLSQSCVVRLHRNVL